MTYSERQNAILHAMSQRRHDTMAHLASEFGVSVRTIRRDIETLSLKEPLYTKQGRYGGGVYLLDCRRTEELRREALWQALCTWVREHSAEILPLSSEISEASLSAICRRLLTMLDSKTSP
ncbi:MAG: DeoR family transcriptional regulator [Ruminococcaceae bacterium]|nr:DeoR family transcriptional regulator [Oscillospiraceae bacterium]